ncbi:hypothetical protein C8Q77DRAFT_1155734 [Trametes polyzona]|nr:hypothetical protein C8Q77DRAFT_1155734 [Trametes polyzona]
MESEPFELGRAFLASLRREHALSASGESVTSMDALLSLENLAYTATATVQSIINMRRPAVNRLPNELFRKIFAEIPRRWEPPSFDNEALSPIQPRLNWSMVVVQDLIPLTAVCRHWRDIILHDWSFWSTLLGYPSSYSPVTGEIVVSSQTAPQYLNYVHRCVHGPMHVALDRCIPTGRSLQLLKEQHERVQELYIRFPDPFSTATVDIVVVRDGQSFIDDISFPNLHTCVLIDTSQLSQASSGGLLSDNSTRRLHTLGLHRIKDFPSCAFPALTDLTITFPYGVRERVSFKHLLDLLSRAPVLKALRLYDVYIPAPQAPPVHFGAVSTVPLPRLRILELGYRSVARNPRTILHTRYSEAQAFRISFLRSVTLPPSCALHHGAVHPEHVALSLHISHRSPGPAALSLHELAPRREDSVTVSFRFSFEDDASAGDVSLEVEGSLQQGLHPAPAALPVDSDETLRNVFRNRLTDTLSSAEELASISSLWVSGSIWWMFGPRPTSFLCALPRLGRVRVDLNFGTDGRDDLGELSSILDSLLPVDSTHEDWENGTQGPPSQPLPRVLCPGLKQIWVHWDGVPEAHHSTPADDYESTQLRLLSHAEEAGPPESGGVIALLSQFAGARAEAERPLSLLYLSWAAGRHRYVLQNYTNLDGLALGHELEPTEVWKYDSDEALQARLAEEWRELPL